MSGRFEERLKELKDLPDLEPPAALEQRTLTAMAAASAPRRSPWLARAAVWIAAIGAAGLLALNGIEFEQPDDTDAPVANEDLYYELLAESAALEQVLYTLPPPRHVMRVGTAGTIVGLENRIALIDAELVRADAEASRPEYRNALLLDRVETMNALVNVRYAQSRAFTF